jgi:PIN domain nuclease of toxin-antitoxin system
MEGTGLKHLLDTAVWINGVTMPETLPPRIRRLLLTEEPKGLSSVTLLETAILYRLGRFTTEAALPAFFSAALSSDLRLLELTAAIAAHTNELPAGFQGDPFDRAIVATAAVLNLTLITTDRAIRDARACSVEYYPFRK